MSEKHIHEYLLKKEWSIIKFSNWSATNKMELEHLVSLNCFGVSTGVIQYLDLAFAVNVLRFKGFEIHWARTSSF